MTSSVEYLVMHAGFHHINSFPSSHPTPFAVKFTNAGAAVSLTQVKRAADFAGI